MEQTILHRLAVFRADFTLDAATEVAAGDGISVEQIYAGMLTLSAKSLVTTDVSGETPQHYHRLLHVTRAFVALRLGESPERGRVVRRHAEYLCRLLVRAEADWETMERRQWLAVYARVIDDVRAALDWAFSPDGDAAIGVALTAWSLPLGYQLSLIDELRVWVERALLHAGLIAPAQPLLEMRLNIAMIRLSQNLTVPVPGAAPGFDRAVELSRQLDDLGAAGRAADRPCDLLPGCGRLRGRCRTLRQGVGQSPRPPAVRRRCLVWIALRRRRITSMATMPRRGGWRGA